MARSRSCRAIERAWLGDCGLARGRRTRVRHRAAPDARPQRCLAAHVRSHLRECHAEFRYQAECAADGCDRRPRRRAGPRHRHGTGAQRRGPRREGMDGDGLRRLCRGSRRRQGAGRTCRREHHRDPGERRSIRPGHEPVGSRCRDLRPRRNCRRRLRDAPAAIPASRGRGGGGELRVGPWLRRSDARWTSTPQTSGTRSPPSRSCASKTRTPSPTGIRRPRVSFGWSRRRCPSRIQAS